MTVKESKEILSECSDSHKVEVRYRGPYIEICRDDLFDQIDVNDIEIGKNDITICFN